MSGPVNTVLGYLAARSRGDTLGAPGDIGTAPPLRPRQGPVPTTDDAAASPFGFVEEHAEIERPAPRRRPPPAKNSLEVTSDRPIQAATAPEAVPRAIPEHRPAPTPTRAPLQAASATTETATEAAAPLKTPPPIVTTSTSAPVKAFAQPLDPGKAPAHREVATEPVSTAPASERAAPDRTIIETRDAPVRTDAQPPPVARPTALTEAQSTIAPSEADEAPRVATGTDRSPPPLEPPAERIAAARPEASFERPTERPRAAREAPASAPTAPPQVQITIGRVEIRAAAPPPAPAPRGPVMSLDDYLAKRAGG